MTIQELLLHSSQTLENYSPTPELDARVLVSHSLKINLTQLILNRNDTLHPKDITTIQLLIEQRQQGTPIAYIIGSKEFYGHTFIVTPDVLIPRPDTECMIDWLHNHHNQYNGQTIVDIGTGSGCIAISLAHLFEKSSVIATDISPNALSIAKKNATLVLGTDQCRIQWYQGDLLEALPLNTRPAIILANLPYLDQNIYTDDSIRHEPPLALFSPQKGLEHYYRLIEYLTCHLFFVPKILIVEINPEQYQAMKDIVTAQFPNNTCEIIYDLAGDIRHLVFSLPIITNQ